MYKRNQVESAIERAIFGARGSREAVARLRVRIKRLIETDRGMAVDRRARDAYRTFAFFDEPPPGRGTEVTYSDFGAFALLLASRLMDAGLPQTDAVLFMRRVRTELEEEHARILARQWKNLLDHKPDDTIEEEVAAGRLVNRFDSMTFLVVLGSQVTVRVAPSGRVSVANIVHGTKQMTKLMGHLASQSGGPILALELVNPAHQLAFWLARVEPIKRGRR